MSLTISSSPVDAIMPGAALVVGYEDGRLYLGARYNHTHVHIAESCRDEIEKAWTGGHATHLFCRGWSNDDICTCRPDDAS